MYFKYFSIHCVFLVMCVSTVVCLKKDRFFCQQSSPCTCISANNDIINLSGINITLNIATNILLNYKPCPNDEPNPNIAAVST